MTPCSSLQLIGEHAAVLKRRNEKSTRFGCEAEIGASCALGRQIENLLDGTLRRNVIDASLHVREQNAAAAVSAETVDVPRGQGRDVAQSLGRQLDRAKACVRGATDQERVAGHADPVDLGEQATGQ